MPESIFKLQPDRTLALRGFDDLGASAALHSATPNSFKVSGTFRDQADFAVLILYDADNFYEHPRLKYLPDTNFAGLTLTFDVRYTGLMPLESPKFPTIDWPFLDVIPPMGNPVSVRLWDPSRATQVGGTYTAAETVFHIEDNGLKEFDRLTLWYRNVNFDYLVPKVEAAFAFTSAGAGTVHSITVAGQPYSYTEQGGDHDALIAQALVDLLAASPKVGAARGDGSPELGSVNQVNLKAKGGDGTPFAVSASSTAQIFTLHSVGASTVAADLAAQINAVNWANTDAPIGLSAEVSGAELRIRALRKGYDSNMLRMYSVAKNNRLKATEPVGVFTGGSSDAIWRITIDFSALGIASVRQMWMTFAPQLTDGVEFQDLEWEAEFTSWTVSGPENVRLLKVAGENSQRVEEEDGRCTYNRQWPAEIGFYSHGYARRASVIGDWVQVVYRSQFTHDLWLGTSLYVDRGVVGVQLDGGAESMLDCSLATAAAVNSRRLVRSAVPPGEHTVRITLRTTGVFYFDFLEAAVPADCPDALPARTNISPALDYSTDHSYKLSPARLMWSFDKLGLAAPMNEYIGVFWWNQRRREGAVFPQAQVTFTGDFVNGDSIFISIGGQSFGKSVRANEDNAIIARHFAFTINATFVGVWASAQGNVLTVRTRSPKQAYSQTFSAWADLVGGSTGVVQVTGSLIEGVQGKWVVDPAQLPALNRGARDWHSDMFRECHQRGREITVATSMELVNPPGGFAATFPNDAIVETAVGFGSYVSTHCSFSAAMNAYHKQVYRTIADLMAGAGLTPNLQFGEFLWWFFTNHSAQNPSGGMAYYDAETKTAAQAALGRPLHRFLGPDDDPSISAGADATFLRNRLRDYVASLVSYLRSLHPNCQLELLFPYDVNHPVPAGVHLLGGRLNRFLNLPAEWETKPTSGLDRIKMEALDFGAWSRNLDLAGSAIMLPIQLGWPRDSVRHLVPVFRAGYPWEKEYRMALEAGVSVVNLWAFDHVAIYGWPVIDSGGVRRAVKMG